MSRCDRTGFGHEVELVFAMISGLWNFLVEYTGEIEEDLRGIFPCRKKSTRIHQATVPTPRSASLLPKIAET